jgi:DNA recombination protein RmuC
MTQAEFIILALLAAIAVVLQLVLLMRGRGNHDAQFERMERTLQASAQATRQELAASMAHNHGASVQQLESMRQHIHMQGASGREEQAVTLKRLADTLGRSLSTLTESNAQRMLEVRATLEAKIRDCRSITRRGWKRCARPSTRSCTPRLRRA